MKQEISLAEFQNEPASVLRQVQEKAQTLLDKVNREQALTEVEFGFLLRHTYVDEGHRSLFCDAVRLRLLANFGGISSLHPLVWEELA